MSNRLLQTLSPLFGAAIVLAFAAFLAGCATTENRSGRILLQVTHSRTGEVLFIHPVQVNDEIRLSWIHSVELTPWEEYYLILETQELLLTKTRFQSYGAGVPEYGGTFRKEKEWMIHDNINRVLPAIQWIHSRTARFHVDINNTLLIQPENLPHHEPLKLSIISETR